MLLGVLSDTHGRHNACRRAVALLQAQKVDAFIHCGDVGDHARPAERVLDALAGTGCHFVWGNNDDAGPAGVSYATDLGLQWHPDGTTISLGNRSICISHGDDFVLTRRLARSAEQRGDVPDLLLTGHSHVPHDDQFGPMRWVNPGALYRTRVKTVATIDLSRLTDRDAVKHLTVKIDA